MMVTVMVMVMMITEKGWGGRRRPIRRRDPNYLDPQLIPRPKVPGGKR